MAKSSKNRHTQIHAAKHFRVHGNRRKCRTITRSPTMIHHGNTERKKKIKTARINAMTDVGMTLQDTSK